MRFHETINSSTLLEMSSVELASILAAFVVRYELQMVEQFEETRCRLGKFFVREWIQGAALATGKKEDIENHQIEVICTVHRRTRGVFIKCGR